MNKKFKTLLTAGLITVIAGSSVVSSSALSKNTINNCKKKDSIYLCINGVKYKIPLGCNNKPSTDNNNQNNNNTNTDNNNNQNNDNINTDNNNSNNNNTNVGNNNSNTNTNNNNNQENNNTNTDDKNDNENIVEKPGNNDNISNDNTTNEFLSFQKEVVRLVNVERAKVGLKELSFNAELSNVATLKSQDMINKNYFSHTSPTYGSPFDMMKKFNISYKTAGENIAKGQKTPAQVVNAWMNSQGHRENILNKNYTEIGIGVAKDAKGTLYWTQMFIGK